MVVPKSGSFFNVRWMNSMSKPDMLRKTVFWFAKTKKKKFSPGQKHYNEIKEKEKIGIQSSL